jgi:signal transduction histidine kinase
VHNAARHSGCTAARISLVAERRVLTLVVTDNGRGFDPLKENEGHGLLNMRKRAQRLNGNLAIRSEAGVGTTVTLSVPL